MQKRKKSMESKISLNNPVAKFAYKFNKSSVFKDKTKEPLAKLQISPDYSC